MIEIGLIRLAKFLRRRAQIYRVQRRAGDACRAICRSSGKSAA
jgi:hypothetical protein